MPNQDDLFQLVFLNAINNGGHTVSMCNADTCNPGAMAGERGRVCAMTLCRKVVNDFLPRPSAMPGSVNQNKCFTHTAFLPPRLVPGCSSRDRQMSQIEQPFGIAVIDQFTI